MRNSNKHSKGFTLIETMVAITILSFAVTGPFITANKAMVAAGISRDKLIASYLAQEGIEYVRLLRDNAYLSAYSMGGTSVSTYAWDSFIAGPIAACSMANCTLGLPSVPRFTRAIRAYDSSPTDMRIVSTVSWSFHGIGYSISISDNLTPWQ